MIKISNLGMLSKILCVVGLLSILTTGITVYSATRMRQIDDRYGDLLDGYAKANLAVARANRNLVYIDRSFFRLLNETSADGKSAAVKDIQDTTGFFNNQVKIALKSLPEQAAPIEAVQQELDKTLKVSCADVLRLGSTLNEADARAASVKMHDLCDPALNKVMTNISGLTNDLQKLLDHASDQTQSITDLTIINSYVTAALGQILACCFSLAIAIFGISRPLTALTAAMRELAGGNNEVVVPARGRRDEIGSMSEALQTFKDNAIEQRRLEAMALVDRRALEDARKQMDQQRADNELQKTQGLLAMVEQVEHETKQAVSTVVQLIDDMTSITQTMADTSRTLSDNAETVADAANEAQTLMQSAREATENLSTSIDKVASQVRTTHEVTAKAVQASENTGRSIEALSNVVNEITGVTKIITDIARQTHLLAINAGVEATRSGQDGRGFAVIAMEVKTLSEQTSGATNKIADLVRQVHSSTNGAVDAVTEIARTIQSVNSAAEEMSRAIGNQVDMTRQIASSVNETTNAAAQVTGRVQQIAAEVAASGAQAQQVDDMCMAVAEHARALHTNLVKIVRTCSEDIDRRSFHRVPMDLQANVDVNGRQTSVAVADISLGGMQIAGSVGRVGEPVNVRLLGLKPVLGGRIVHASETATHVQFELSAEDREALEALMQGRTRMSRAA